MKTVKDAVEQEGGIWKNEDANVMMWISGLIDYGDLEDPEDIDHLNNGWQLVCTREQFEAEVAIPAWNGEGRPPVGVECEVLHNGEWHWTYIIGHDRDGCAVYLCEDFDDDHVYDGTSSTSNFRLLKTEAEKERELVITNIQCVSQGEMGVPISATQAINIYNAGYRLREQKQ